MSQPNSLPEYDFPIDRDAAKRDHPDLFDQLWANPNTRVLAVHAGKVLLEDPSHHHLAQLRLLPVDQVSSAVFRAYLGVTLTDELQPAGTPVVLASLSENAAAALEPDAAAWHEVRRLGKGLSPRDLALYLQALALTNFHQNHGYCQKCGQPTMVQQGGWSRSCLTAGHQIFPRNDPAVIVAVTDDQDRILLGSQGVWEENRWSILAGFVEAGESLTETVLREIEEEAGIKVRDVEFVASQAWPFPYSLMLGFTAKQDTNQPAFEPRPDGVELVKARWFTREEIRAGLADDSLIMPGPITIARTLIERWYGGPLDV